MEELLREWREHLGIVMNVWDVVGGSKSEGGHPWGVEERERVFIGDYLFSYFAWTYYVIAKYEHRFR